MINAQYLFEENQQEYGRWERLSKLEFPTDITAFLLLRKLCPSMVPIISCAEHDIIYLDVDIGELEKVASEDDIITLLRCGVRYDPSYDCLTMFV